MNNKREKFIFWLMGLGCGILLSGMLGTFLSLNILSNEFKLVNDTLMENKKSNEISEVKDELTEEQIIQRALDLGMKFESITNEITKEQTQGKDKDEDVTVKIYVSSGLGATGICKLLEENKVIADANEFREYIRKQDKLTSLREGEFEFPRNIGYEEALKILLREK